MFRVHPAVSRWVPPVAILLFYFLVPVSARDAPVGDVIGISVGIASVAAVAWVIFSEARRADKRLKPIHLLLAFELVLVIFSLGYYILATSHPTEFVGLDTRLDALYFSLATMSTVGYGDVHAAGQIARTIVTVQLAFNLVFIASLVALLQDQVRRGAWHRRKGSSAEEADAPDPT
jgi:voltage-gated potassium channel